MHGHPLEPEDFSFTDTRERDGKVVRIIRSHIAYDARWPWWRSNT